MRLGGGLISSFFVFFLTSVEADRSRSEPLRIMFASRLSRLVGQIAKESIKGQSSLIRRGYFGGPFNHYLHPMFFLSANNTWSHGILTCKTSYMSLFQKNCPFSTTTSDKTHEQGSGEQKETISVTFVNKDGEEKLIKVPIGMSMLEAAHENDIELEGACEGSLACSTCHVIVMDVDYYNKLEEPTDEENDMLDLAFGLTETSRLGCQVIAKPELDGIRLALPAATRNFAVDGYVPKPH